MSSCDFYKYLNTHSNSDNFFASSIIPNLVKFISIIAFPLGIVLSPISIGLKKISLFLIEFF